jgi:hypothetical protein
VPDKRDHPRSQHCGSSLRGSASDISSEESCTAQKPAHLRAEHLSNLADFLLDFAGELFVLTFGLQVRIVGYLACFLFDFDLILRARFHLVSPFLDGTLVSHGG